MDQHNSSFVRERAIYRYVRALDAGNMDEIIAVLQIVESDPELDRIISEINNSFAEELPQFSLSQDANRVRDLLHSHLPSRYPEAVEDSPLIVSEVISRLVSERIIPDADLEISHKLLHVHMSLPEWLSLAEIRKLGVQLRVQASDRFWKVFRDTAIQMSMGRGQAQMAAARRKYTYRLQSPHEESSKEERHDP